MEIYNDPEGSAKGGSTGSNAARTVSWSARPTLASGWPYPPPYAKRDHHHRAMSVSHPEETLSASAAQKTVVRYHSVTPSTSGFGVHLHESDDAARAVTIDQIVAGGQADKAGLRTDDEVVSIAGHSTAGGDLQKVLEAVGAITRERPSEPVEWVVRRAPEADVGSSSAAFEHDYAASVELTWAKNSARAAKEQLARSVNNHVAEVSHREELHSRSLDEIASVSRIAKHWRKRRNAQALKSVASAHRVFVDEQKDLAKYANTEASVVRSLHEKLSDDYLELRGTLEQTQLDHRAAALQQQGQHTTALAEQDYAHIRKIAELSHSHSGTLSKAEQEAARSSAAAAAAKAELDSTQQSVSDLLTELTHMRSALLEANSQLEADAARHAAEIQAADGSNTALSAEVSELSEKLAAAEARADAAEEMQQQGLAAQLQTRLVAVGQSGDQAVDATEPMQVEAEPAVVPVTAPLDLAPPPLDLAPPLEPEPELEAHLREARFVLLDEHEAEVARLEEESAVNLEQWQDAVEEQDEIHAELDALRVTMAEAAAVADAAQIGSNSAIAALEQRLQETVLSGQAAAEAHDVAMRHTSAQLSRDSAEFTTTSAGLQSQISEMEAAHSAQVLDFTERVRTAEAAAAEAKQLQQQAEELRLNSEKKHEQEFQATLQARIVKVAAPEVAEEVVEDEGAVPEPEPEPEPELATPSEEPKFVLLHEHEAAVSRLQEESGVNLEQWQDAVVAHEQALEDYAQMTAEKDALAVGMTEEKERTDTAIAGVRATLQETEASRQEAAEHHKRREQDQLATLDLLQNDMAAKREKIESVQAELETQREVNGTLQVEQDVLRQRVVALQQSASNESDRAEHMRRQLRESERARQEVESGLLEDAQAQAATYTELVAAVAEVEQQIAEAEELGEPTDSLKQLLSELREEVFAAQEMAGLREFFEKKEASVFILEGELQDTKAALQVERHEHRVAMARERAGKEVRMKKFLGHMMNNNVQAVLSAWREVVVEELVQRREQEVTNRAASASAAAESANAKSSRLATEKYALEHEAVALRKATAAQQAECAALRTDLAASNAALVASSTAAKATSVELDHFKLRAALLEGEAERASARHASELQVHGAQAPHGTQVVTRVVAAGGRLTIGMVQSPKGFGMNLSDALLVESVVPGGVADKAGVPLGSRIVEVAGVAVQSKREMVGAVTGATSSEMPIVFMLADDSAGAGVGPAELAESREAVKRQQASIAVLEAQAQTARAERALLHKEVEALRAAAGFSEEVIRSDTVAPKEVAKASSARPSSDGTLTVELAQILGLLSADKNGKSDPYVKVSLADATKTSKVIYKTLDPIFNESFSFDIVAAATSSEAWVLQMEVWDKDKGAKDDFLGGATVHLIDAFAGDWSAAGPLEVILVDGEDRLGPKLLAQVKKKGGHRAPCGAATVKLSFEVVKPQPKKVSKQLKQSKKGFGITMTDSLHVSKLVPGGAAEAVDVPTPSRVVEVAGFAIDNKKELMKVIAQHKGKRTLEFVFLTSPEPQPQPQLEPEPELQIGGPSAEDLAALSPRTKTLTLQQREEMELDEIDLPRATQSTSFAEKDALVASLRAELQAVQLLAVQHSEQGTTVVREVSDEEADRLRAALEMVTAERALLQKQLDAMRGDTGPVPAAAGVSSSEEATQLKALLGKALADHQAVLKKHHSTTRQIDDLQDELEAEQETVLALEAEIHEIVAEARSGVATGICHECKALRSVLDHKTTQLDHKVTEVSSLRTDVEKAQAELSTQREAADTRVGDAERGLETSSATAHELRVKLRESEKARRDQEEAAEDEAIKRVQDVEEAPASYKELIEAVSDVEQQIAEDEADGQPTDELTELLAELKQQVLDTEEAAGVREKLAEKEAQPASYAELVEGVSEVEQQITEAEAAGEPTEQLQELLVELREEVFNAQELAGLRDELEAKETAIASLQGEVSQATKKQLRMDKLRTVLREEETRRAAEDAALFAKIANTPPTSPMPSDDELVDDADTEEGEPPAPEELLQMDPRLIFDELDADNSGFLQRSKIAVLCCRMGRSQSDESISHAFSVIDTNHNGEVDWKEFSVWWAWTAQHEEEAALGHRAEDYPNHAFWAKLSVNPDAPVAMKPAEVLAIAAEDEKNLILEGDSGPPVDGTLTVTLVKCSGLLAADKNGKSDPYVTLTLGGAQPKATKAKSKTVDPVFNQSFSYDIKAGDTSSLLALEVWDKDRGAKDDLLGEASVQLVSVFAGKWSSATVGPLEFAFEDGASRVAPQIAAQVGSRLADGSGWQEHGVATLKFSFEAKKAAAKGKK